MSGNRIVDLFDIKYLYDKWDPVLEGKLVLACDSFVALRGFVRKGQGQVVQVTPSIEENKDTYPFFHADASGSCVFALVYYDPHWSEKVNYYLYAKPIQVYDRKLGSFKPFVPAYLSSWKDEDTYRFYDEGDEEGDTYRPFANLYEFLYFAFDLNNFQDLKEPVYLREKLTGFYRLVTGFADDTLQFGDRWYTFTTLFENYTFADGTPFGAKLLK